MRKIYIFVLILSCCASSKVYCQDCAKDANIYSFTYNGKNYEVVKELKKWKEAAECAVERGGYLVEINNKAEQNAVYDAIINGAAVSPSYATIFNGGGIAYVWIGATDADSEGAWLWDGDFDNTGINFWNGEGVNGANDGAVEDDAYVNWGGKSKGKPNEPDNYSGQDCAAIGLAGWPSGSTDLGIAGEWNDIIGTTLIYYVIEYEVTDVHDKLNQGSEIIVYPNPAFNEIAIKGAKNKNLTISSILGNTVITKKITQDTELIDISDLQNGCYFIILNSAFSSRTFKIIKN